MKTFSEADLWGLVCRADTPEKVMQARAFIQRLSVHDEDLRDALEDALYTIEEELQGREYSPSSPWNAPGMRVSDFVRGVYD